MTKWNKWPGNPAKSQISLGIRPRRSRVFAVHWLGSWGPKVSSCAQRKDWSDWMDALADLGVRRAHRPYCWFCHALAHLCLVLHVWAVTWQNQQIECAPSTDSDQPGHLPSLIRVFAVGMKKPWVLSYPLSAQRRLWSGWSESSLGTHSFCWFCHVAAHLSLKECLIYMSQVKRKPVFRVCDKVRFKLDCSATEAS